MPALALAPLAALVWWGAGFLPWIVDLFGRDILSTNGFSPAALPLLSGSSAGGLVVSAGVGGVLAGLVVTLRRGRGVPAVLSVVAGTVVALVVAIVQARAALGDGSGAAGPVDVRVLDGLGALVVVVTVVGLAVGLGALLGRPGLGVALAAVAGLAPMWAYALAVAVTSEVMTSTHAEPVTRWLGAAVLVVALVVIGVAPVVRLIWWVPALVLAWIAAPTATAALYLGTSVSRGPRSADAVREYVSASWQVWRQSAEPEERPLAPWVTAIVLALVVSALLALRTRARPEHPAPDRPVPDRMGPADEVAEHAEPPASDTQVIRRDPPPSDGPAWP
ncbi:hypothetical protein AERO_04295 [Aeromicrobium fastidiosum]|uniref:hypothetical protein n=1 Tax=Aeromicrobium fastidiosum TaxID=52699 RepID=UPI002023441C|nr:hypothetical protein [Aeromicrobium fastidiosum]MCL8250594.1 hypothetical protein [Aeromicrobium fastidiosum]